MPFDPLIRGGRLIDGSGAPGRLADVGIIVNGRLAVRDGDETGDRPGRLLRRGA